MELRNCGFSGQSAMHFLGQQMVLFQLAIQGIAGNSQTFSRLLDVSATLTQGFGDGLFLNIAQRGETTWKKPS